MTLSDVVSDAVTDVVSGAVSDVVLSAVIYIRFKTLAKETAEQTNAPNWAASR